MAKNKLSKLNVNRGEMATALDRGFEKFAEGNRAGDRRARRCGVRDVTTARGTARCASGG
jgi:hypothetical protein